jgi:hypothetical protein
MSGYQVSVYRQQNDGSSPASFKAPQGTRLALWGAGVCGLDWIAELVRQEEAIFLGGDGYPAQFTAMAKYVIPRLRDEPDFAQLPWKFDQGDTILPAWLGEPAQNTEAMEACGPDEWLLIEAWDQS